MGEHERGGGLEGAGEQIGGAGRLEAQGPPVLAICVTSVSSTSHRGSPPLRIQGHALRARRRPRRRLGHRRGHALRQFRERGIDPAAIRQTLGLAGVISTVGFAVVAAAGAVLTGNPAVAGTGLLTGCGSAAAVTLLIIVAHSPGGRARLQPMAASALRLSQRIARRPAGDPGLIAARVTGRLGSLKLGPRSIGYLLACSLINWTADAFCLAAAIAATGMPIPWDKLLLVWSAGVGAITSARPRSGSASSRRP